MSKIARFTDHDDLALLRLYRRLCNKHDDGHPVGERIDRVVMECYRRGLMGPQGQASHLNDAERAAVVQRCYGRLVVPADVPESPLWEALTQRSARLLLESLPD